MKMTINETTDVSALDGANIICDRCEDGILMKQAIQTAFWRGDGLVVIRNIPAMVCPECGEEYVADRTAIGLDRMRGGGFASTELVEQLIVPVFDYVDPGPSE